MRIRNRSKLDVPKNLWQNLAEEMRLDAVLPKAVDDEFGIYGRNKTLRISIHKPRQASASKSTVTVGSYTFGHVSIFPCENCSAAFLTHVYLHELHHAWLHQYYEQLYENRHSCDMEDEFADHAFDLLGGSISGARKCADYQLDVNRAIGRIGQFRDFVQQHTRRVTELTNEIALEDARRSRNAGH